MMPILTRPKPFSITNSPDGKKYYLAAAIALYNPLLFKGTSKTIRRIIERQKIPEEDYLFANQLKDSNVWNVCDQSCKKAKLLLSKTWVEKHWFNNVWAGYNGGGGESSENIVVPEVSQIIKPEEKKVGIVEKETENVVEEEPENIAVEENEIMEQAPPIFDLEDNEKFKDADGNIIEIETRGERDRKKIFFRLEDISKGFDMKNIREVLLQPHTGYKQNIHYKCLYVRKTDYINVKSYTIKKSLYLTYKGLIRLLFVSRNKHADQFQEWAEEKLFTIQMGSVEKKQELAAECLNVSIKAIQNVFGSSSNTFPCIYLLKLGTVGDLRDTFKISPEIPDTSTIYKYGCSNDFKRRIREHESDYGKLPGIKIELTYFSYIDPKYIFEAEKQLKGFFEFGGFNLCVKKRDELVAVDKDKFKYVKTHYTHLYKEYAGASEELQIKIKELEQEIHILTIKLETNARIHELEKLVLEKNNQVLEKDNQLLQHEIKCLIDQKTKL